MIDLVIFNRYDLFPGLVYKTPFTFRTFLHTNPGEVALKIPCKVILIRDHQLAISIDVPELSPNGHLNKSQSPGKNPRIIIFNRDHYFSCFINKTPFIKTLNGTQSFRKFSDVLKSEIILVS